ncbi:MAG: hypothetical protein HYT80_05460 [Euryarchaeota archaeon]|nr:hypothetical protein [Euryarchaeota archaeon]
MRTVAQCTTSATLARRAGDAFTPTCNLDEDAATLAVEAGRDALAMAHVGPERVTAVVAVGDRASEWGPVAQVALGLRHATLDVRTAPAAPSAVTGVQLALSSAGARVGDAAAAGPTEATARLDVDDGFVGAPGRPFETGRLIGAVALTPDLFQKLVRAEAKALVTVPMGANVPRATWDASLEARYRLLASVCDRCKKGHHPPLNPCPTCGGHTRPESLWKPGRLHTWTVVAAGAGPSEFDPWQDVWGEYGVAVVDYEHGIRIAGMLVDSDLKTLKVGAAMEPVFRRLYAQDGAWRYGAKFRAVG